MTLSEFEAEITDQDIRPIKIVTYALTLGVVLMVSIGLYLYFFKVTDTTPNYNNSLIDTYLIVLGILFIGTLLGSKIASQAALKGENGLGSIEAKRNSFDKRKLIGIFNNQHIIRLAPVEGSAFFGCVVFLVSVLGNQIYATNYDWLSLVPVVFLIFYNLSFMPTKEKVVNILKTAQAEVN